MNKFEKQLEKWNHGILRGAQAKLAKKLGVSTATTALWTTGKRHPSRGYIAQMAFLFNMDETAVINLFKNTPSVVYSQPNFQQHYMLRDADTPSCIYPSLSNSYLFEDDNNPLQSNTVKIPFVSAIHVQEPYYYEDEIMEWWSIPRRYAQGARVLLRSKQIGFEDALSDADLCLFKPATEINSAGVWLFTNKNNHFFPLRVTLQRQTIAYATIQNAPALSVAKKSQPVGQIITRIRPL